jgi:hypothetical protein
MRRGVLFCLCLLLALAASPALAKKKHKKPVKLGPVITATATGNTVSAAGAESTATATCPGGKQAVGGGFSAPLTDLNKLFVTSSFRSSPGAWTVVARQEEGSGATTAVAYCRKAKPAITDIPVPATVPSGEGQVGSGTASCPSGMRLVSGGFQIESGPSPGQFALPTSSLAINTAAIWSVQAVNNTAGAHNFTVHAYCMPRVAAPRFVNSSSEPSVAQGGVGTLSSPTCPTSKKPKKGKKRKPAKLLSAGGFAGQATVPIEIFSDTGINSGIWSISGINVTGPDAPVHLTSQGICV